MENTKFEEVKQYLKKRRFLAVILGIIAFVLITVLSPFLLAIISIIIFIGLIKPQWIWMPKERTRLAMLKIYVPAFLVIGLAGSVFYSGQRTEQRTEGQSNSTIIQTETSVETLIQELNAIYEHHRISPLKRANDFPKSLGQAYRDESAGLFIAFKEDGLAIEYDQFSALHYDVDSVASLNTNMNVTRQLLEHYLENEDINRLYEASIGSACDTAFDQVKEEMNVRPVGIGHSEKQIELDEFILIVNCWWSPAGIDDYTHTRSQSVELRAKK